MKDKLRVWFSVALLTPIVGGCSQPAGQCLSDTSCGPDGACVNGACVVPDPAASSDLLSPDSGLTKVDAAAFGPSRVDAGSDFDAGLSVVNGVEIGSSGCDAPGGELAFRRLSDMSVARAQAAVAVAQDKIYLIGGSTGQTTGAVEAYDPETDTWTLLSPMPTARQGATALTRDARIHVLGGQSRVPRGTSSLGDFEPQNVHEVYDIASDTWSALTPPPRDDEIAYMHAGPTLSGGVIHDSIFVIRGLGPPATLEYDSEGDRWRTRRSPPSALGASIALGGHLYAAGIWQQGGANRAFFEFFADDELWVRRPSVPAQPAGATLVAGGLGTRRGVIYYAGGMSYEDSSYRVISAKIWSYDPQVNRWSFAGLQSSGRHSAALAELHGKLYIAGGSTSPHLDRPIPTARLEVSCP